MHWDVLEKYIINMPKLVRQFQSLFNTVSIRNELFSFVEYWGEKVKWIWIIHPNTSLLELIATIFLIEWIMIIMYLWWLNIIKHHFFYIYCDSILWPLICLYRFDIHFYFSFGLSWKNMIINAILMKSSYSLRSFFSRSMSIYQFWSDNELKIKQTKE